jgi:hypothetical protein
MIDNSANQTGLIHDVSNFDDRSSPPAYKPEQATAIARDTGDITTHPFQSSLVNIGEQATLTDLGISHTIDQIVGVEYASHMMVPSATNIMRIHGLSQIIRMNNQGSKRKMDLFQRVKIMSTQTDDDLTVCKKTAE